MPTLHAPEVLQRADTSMTARHPWWRAVVLCLLLLLSVVIYFLLIGATPRIDGQTVPFLHICMISFLPYFAGCAFGLATKPLTGLFLVFDMVTCMALLVLLKRKGLDQRRVLLYAWCPLPIVEFAIQGHVDVITLTFTLLAVLSAASTSVRGRVLTGFLTGFAALTKIYPILLLAVVLLALPDGERDVNNRGMALLRKVLSRNTPFLITSFSPILLGYLPYLILAPGQCFAFFATSAAQQPQNARTVSHIV